MQSDLREETSFTVVSGNFWILNSFPILRIEQK